MTRYASKVKADEDNLIVENFGSIDAFLTILERRIAEAYYQAYDNPTRDNLRKEMNAVDIVHGKLNKICCGKENTGD